MINQLVWYCTEACNCRCPYCREVKISRYQETHTCDEWLQAFEKVDFDALSLTGGELFLIPWMVEFLTKINHRIAFTTNLTQDIIKFVKEVPKEKVIHICVSWHPSQNIISLEHITSKLLLLKERDYSIQVNYVTYPDQILMIPYYRDWFEEYGIPFHVDPYVPVNLIQGMVGCLQGSTEELVLTEKENRILDQYTSADRELHPWTKQFGNSYCVECNSGESHRVVYANGDVYRCFTYACLGHSKIGNLFDEQSNTVSKEICYDHYRCLACDRDKITCELVSRGSTTRC